MILEQKPKKPPRKKPKPSAMTRPPKRNKKKKKPPTTKNFVSQTTQQPLLQQQNHLQQQQHHNQNQRHDQSTQQPTQSYHHPQPKTMQILNQKISPMMKYIVNGPGNHRQIKNVSTSGNQMHISAQTLASLQHNHNHKTLMTPGSTQDVLNVCENSSAYESSEDTGVGGLSESEMIHHDVIGTKLYLIKYNCYIYLLLISFSRRNSSW